VKRLAAVILATAVGGLLLASPAAAHHPFDGEGRYFPWSLPPSVLAMTGLVLALFIHGMWRLRRRGRSDLAGWDRLVLFVAGLTLIVFALASPLDPIGEEYLLSAHMLQHMALVDLGPALLLLAVRGPLLFFILPAAILGPIARNSWVRNTLGFLVKPAVAIAIWCAVFAFWHVPSLYQRAIREGVLHDLEHISYLIAGLLIWTVLIDPAQHNRVRRSVRIGTAVVVFAAGQILSEILLFSSKVYYPLYELQPDRLFGISALTDQRYAGAIMMIEQALVIGTFMLVFFLLEDQADRRRYAENAPQIRPIA